MQRPFRWLMVETPSWLMGTVLRAQVASAATKNGASDCLEKESSFDLSPRSNYE